MHSQHDLACNNVSGHPAHFHQPRGHAPGPLPRPPALPVPGYCGGLDYYAAPPLLMASSSRSIGRNYLRSLGPPVDTFEQMTIVDAGRSQAFPPYDKPLPPLPAPSVRLHWNTPRPDVHAGPSRSPRPMPHETLTPQHRLPASPRPPSFRPSALLSPPSPPRLLRPKSDPSVPVKPKDRRSSIPIIDLSLSSSDAASSADDSSSPRKVTPRSKARRKRATSEQPRLPAPSPSASPSKITRQSSCSPAVSAAVRCAGFTRTGAPCKRLVKTSAPVLALEPPSSIEANRPMPRGNAAADLGRTDAGAADDGDDAQLGLGRYCKDHAGMICEQKGFYSQAKRGVWVDFDDWIPPELGQQTQTLLRMVMESSLSAKESPGFLYAYELRDLQTPTTSFFKVGRTDNVPRRIGQWMSRCQSHTPTLRDIFPLPSSSSPTTHSPSPSQTGSRPVSLLPGAISHGTLPTTPPNPAVKRWERLVHLELAEVSATARPAEWQRLREERCDCGKGHREIFALPREQEGESGRAGAERGGGVEGEGSYQVVVEIASRWERFVRHVCGE